MITLEEFKTNKKYWVYTGIIVIFLFLICSGPDGRYEKRNENANQNVISVTGHGEVQATPDVASVYFTVRKEAKKVAEAQAELAVIINKSIAMLDASGIAKADIKTESKSFNPKYEHRYNTIVCKTDVPCPPNGNNVVVGYEAYQSTTVKVKKIDDAGKIIEELGKLGVTELSGPNFTVDNQDAKKTDARNLAIKDAKVKAKALAKELGIRLGEITSYNENGNYPVPMYAKTTMMDSAVGAAAPAELSVGQDTISSDVTITYEIR